MTTPIPASARDAAMPVLSRDDLAAIEAEFLKQCGSCDAGLLTGCVCSQRDYRPTMARLLAEVGTLRQVMADTARKLDVLPGAVGLAEHLRAEAGQ